MSGVFSATSELQNPAISLENITKSFPGVVANDNISLNLQTGKVHCLLGENGAGKSTLISILAGMQLPDSGTIRIDGKATVISSPKVAMNHGIGVVYQHSTFVPTLSVIDNLMLGSDGIMKNVKRAIARLHELFGVLGADIDPYAMAGDLGLGQRQQVEIAKAMWNGSRLLILDEPTSMLTPSAIQGLSNSIHSLTARGIGVVFITHKLREAYAIGDSVTVLRAGKNVLHIPEAEMKRLSEDELQQSVLTAMFGSSNMHAELTDLADLAGAHRAQRTTKDADFEQRPATLELVEVSTPHTSLDLTVKEISLSLKKGEVLGIAGIDGHGQRGLAEVIAGQLAMTHGEMKLNGKGVQSKGVTSRQRAGLRYITDDRHYEGTVGDLPVAINLVLKKIGQRPFWRWGIANNQSIAEHAKGKVETFNIRTPTVMTRASALSGGNLQKLLLARELGDGATVVIVNKPTYGLDLNSVRFVHDTLKEFVSDGGSILLFSNELDELVELSHRIAVISNGQIVGEVENDGAQVAERVGRLMIGGANHE